MTPERWAQVNEILNRALQLAPADRSAFLNQACAPDDELRREVESLLVASDEVRASFLHSPLSDELRKGTRLGNYEVQSLLGSGGMGEVYRARDLRLRREVAIKVLPAFVSSDPERLRRFEQEALATAALNHPNILAVYQLGSHEGTPYLVTELLEGETLRQKIRHGKIAVSRAVDYAIQIARGLAAAHEKGIVHRDLKPENIFVTKDGRIKILDFGLAKLTQAPQSSQHSSPTLGSETEPGMVMGTAGYMAPEQVRAESVDHRADVFAFGAVLYEMLTGQRAFQKPTAVETMTAILKEESAPMSQLMPQISLALQRVVQRCLQKNREQRFQSASDLAFALESLSDFPAPSANVGRIDQTSRKPRLTLIGLAIAGLAIVALVTLTSYWYFRQTGVYDAPATKLTEKDTIVLADFVNSTGDPIFDDTLKQALSTALRQSPLLNVLSENQVGATLQLMSRPKNAPLTPEVSREVCLRANSKAWIRGSISSIGTEYVIGLKAVNCQNGDTLAQNQVTAASKEKVLDALGMAAGRLRAELGESLANVQKFDAPLSQASTASLDALKAYSIGTKALHEKGTDAALPFFQHAVELDPDFASAYDALGKMYFNLREYNRAKEFMTKAYALREHASERERFDIESGYCSFVTGNLEDAVRVFKEWLTSYPGDETALGNLGLAYGSLGDYDEAASVTIESLQRSPNDSIGYLNAAAYQMALDRVPEARKTIQQALDRKLDSVILHAILYSLAFLSNDEPTMTAQVTWSQGKSETVPILLAMQSSKEGYFGRGKKARELNRLAVESLERLGRKERALNERMTAVLRDVAFGDVAEPRKAAISVLSQPIVGNYAKQEGALLFAWLGDASRAESLVDSLAKNSPEDTIIQSVVLPTVRAEVELFKKNPKQSIELLRVATPYELTWDAFGGASYEGCLYPIYIRGQAYLALKDGAAAGAEFEKILNHPGIVRTCETGALARLGLARAYVLQSNTSKAKAAYQDFLALWKDADPGIPVLQQAKGEYANLTH